MMDSPGHFEYDGLDRTKDEIRLLTLSPNQEDGILRLQLKHGPLASVQSSYDAYSYAWGSSKAESLILVNGRRFFLRENAYRFLCHQLRVNADQVPFWMDTICIDQNNVEEKSGQVAKMDRIFASAVKVLIWLESHSESEAIAEPYLRYSKAEYDLKAPRSLMKLFTTAKAAWNEKTVRITSASKEAEKLAAIAALKPLVNDLLNAKYWERLWIVQEIILAKSAFIIAGTVRIDFAQMLDLVGFEDNQSSIAKFVMTMWISRMELIRSSQSGAEQGQPMTELVELCKTQICYDHRDRIYGLLGLSKDLNGLSVDYQDSLDLLFAKVVRQLTNNKPNRTNVMIKEIPTFIQALDITSESMSQALKRSKEEKEVLTRRDIPIEMTCEYALKPVHCVEKLNTQCPGDLSKLLEPGNQHVTFPSWLEDECRCFEKSLVRSEAVESVSNLTLPNQALLCRITQIGGNYILSAAKSRDLRIQQCFTDEWVADALPRTYVAGFQLQARTACTYSVQVSPADLILLHECFASAQGMPQSCMELVELILERTPEQNQL